MKRKSLRGALATKQSPHPQPSPSRGEGEGGGNRGIATPGACPEPFATSTLLSANGRRGLAMTSAVLLVIDMQRYFLDPRCDAFLKDGPKIIPNVKKLISAFRNANLPVIFTRHAHKKGEPAGQMSRWWNNKLPWDGDPQSEIISELTPKSNEPVITKTCYSAFEKTNLESHLRNNNLTTVVLCGVMTHLCVETTARHAFMLDFQPVVVSDACATQTEEYHKASLLNLAHGFAHIVTTEEFLTTEI